MGETRVDLHHLLEDLRDAYPESVEETILTEIVANSLDSGAHRIVFTTDAAAATLTAVDDGSGMQRRDLARYHDLATSTKTRGAGIGFAGVGIKLGLLVCDYVLTETRRGKTHVATTWHLSGRHKAPWKWLATPPGMVAERGTAVRLKLTNPLSPLLDAGYVEAALRRHFQPLLDPSLDELLLPHYGRAVVLEVNGHELARTTPRTTERAPLAVRLLRKRKPSAIGWLVRESAPLPEDQRGVAISTFGKVIRRGWDWLGVTPANPDRITGLIEAPALAECLTLNKGDFIRTGPRGSTYLTYRRAIQEVVGRQLAEWGDARDAEEQARRRVARPVERDLEGVLVGLTDEFPMLASLVEQRLGGQRKLPIGKPGEAEDVTMFRAGAGAAGAAAPMEVAQGAPARDPDTEADDAATATGVMQPPDVTARESEPPEARAGGEGSGSEPKPAVPGPRRPARYGLSIERVSRPDDAEIARLVDTTVLVNESHPAYRRALISRAEGYHLALAVAMALAPLATDTSGHHAFVTAFMAHWGEAIEKRKDGRRKRR